MAHAKPCLGCGRLIAITTQGRCENCAIDRPRIPQRLRDAVLDEANDLCEICGREPATTVDHVVPVKYGGTNDRGNLQAACLSCNSRKGDRAA